MFKKKILVNAIMSVTQVLVTTLVVFVLYRFLISVIGIEQLGIWSLVLSTVSVAQIANFGISLSVVKFVAKYIALDQEDKASGVVQTAAISGGVICGVVFSASYPLIKWILSLAVPRVSLDIAISILPYSLIFCWFMVMISIFIAGLDGCQRIDIRSSLMMFGTILHLLLCFILAPRYGLFGVVYAGLIQNSVLFVLSWGLLKKYMKKMPLFPLRWDKELFKEMFSYGVQTQLVTITAMLGEPITKIFLSKFGNLSMVGYYEMASKMTRQIRLLIASANQVLVPTISGFKEKMPGRIRTLYLNSYKVIFYLSLPLYSLIIICLPLISMVLIGRIEPVFMLMGVLLSAGMLFNTISIPAYYANIGTGDLKWNVFGHVLTVCLNACLGFWFGKMFGGIGVVGAIVTSITIGSGLIYIMYHRIYNISYAELFAGKSLILSTVLALVVSFVVFKTFGARAGILEVNIIALAVFALFTAVPLWKHPTRRFLLNWFYKAFRPERDGVISA